MQSITDVLAPGGETANTDNVRNLSAAPALGKYSGASAGAQPRLLDSQAQVVTAIQAPTLSSLNGVVMVPTQLASYVLGGDVDLRFSWDSLSYEARNRMGTIDAQGGFAYTSHFQRRAEFANPARVSYTPPTSVGAYVDANLEPADADHAPASAMAMIERPHPATEDARGFIAEAEAFRSLQAGATVPQTHIKLFNHLLAQHRYYGNQGSVFKEEWKVAESDRIQRMAMMARMAGHGQLYIRMFTKLLLFYHSALLVEQSGCTGTSHMTAHAGYPDESYPTLVWCDSKPPRFSADVEIFRVPVNITAGTYNVAQRLEDGIYVFRVVGGELYRYRTEAAMIADWNTWNAPAANYAAAAVHAMRYDLARLAKQSLGVVSKVEPKELPGLVVGGEDALWEDFMRIHQREHFLLDVEGLPDDAVEVLLVALAAKETVLNRERSAADNRRFLPHAESIVWERDYSQVYVHSGAVTVDRIRSHFLRGRGYASRVIDRAGWSSGKICNAIRHFLLKTGAEDDFSLAVEIVESSMFATDLSAIKGHSNAAIAAVRSIFQGNELRLPLDVSLPAYFYPFKLQGDLRSETEEWLSLRPIPRINVAYYRHVMLQVSWGWAAFSSSASGHVWRRSTANPTPDQAAQIEHGRELTQRRSEYSLSLLDSILASACAHMYGWAPSREALLSFSPHKTQATSATNFTPIDLGTLFQGHTTPHGVHAYAELWLANKLPDFMVLPVPEGTVKWPDDKPRPVVDSSGDTSQVRLGATMAPLDYKYWQSDGGAMYSAQYYVAANASRNPSDESTRYSHTPIERVAFGAWNKPVQHEWPTGPAQVLMTTAGGMRLDGDFSDYFDPFLMRTYDHLQKLPKAFGVQRVDQAAAPAVQRGPVESWFRLARGETEVAPCLVYEPPAWAVREVEPLADYYLAALVDKLEGRFSGYHWASVVRTGNGTPFGRDGPSKQVVLNRVAPIQHSSALANDNDPNEPASNGRSARRGGGRRGRRSTAAKRLETDILASEMAASDPTPGLASHMTATPEGAAISTLVEEANRTPAVKYQPAPVELVRPNDGVYTTADGKRVQRAQVISTGGNATRRSAVRPAGRPLRTAKGRVLGGAGGGGGSGPRANVALTAPGATTSGGLGAAVQAAASQPRAALRSILAAGRAAIQVGTEHALVSFAEDIQNRRISGRSLKPNEARGLADVISEGIGSGQLAVGAARNLLKVAPEAERCLPEPIKDRIGNYKSLDFGEVEVEILSPRGVDELQASAPELTDAAAYEAQFEAAGQATSFELEPVTEGKGHSPGAAYKDEGGARLGVLDLAESDPALN